MTISRQDAFQKLRGPCVELGSVSLQFKAGRGTVKQVFAALSAVHTVLRDLSKQDVLDHKLAEYAFFPLTHVFNESKRLSPSCLEIAVNCVVILVNKGWQHQLLPAMGKQLLILMTLMSGSESSDTSKKPPDDLQVACFRCIGALLHWTKNDQATSNNESPRSLTDQVVYILLEAVMTSSADQVQFTAAQALGVVFTSQQDHLLLTSLLPRTVSGLTKVLKPSTQARRTQLVLSEYLLLLKLVLKATLSDDLIFTDSLEKTSEGEKDLLRSGLELSWLKATAPQVAIALTYVTRLRTHNGIKVRNALVELCLMVSQDCSRTLSDSLPVMVETMILLAANDDLPLARESIEHLVTIDSNIGDLIRSKLYEWSRALPRMMLAHDDQKKREVLSEISTSFDILTKTLQMPPSLMNDLGPNILNAFAGQMDVSGKKSQLTNIVSEQPDMSLILKAGSSTHFSLVLLNHQSQTDSRQQLQKLVGSFQNTSHGGTICRQWVDVAAESEGTIQLSAIWLALEFLRSKTDDFFDVESFVDQETDVSDLSTTRPYLISDLYAAVLPYITELDLSGESVSQRWQLVALSLECLILQAQQLGDSYRPELVDTLYPVLTILASPNQALQSHAITTLNLLASACRYQSVIDMVLQNVDYLVNSVALKLNAFDVSPPAVKVVQMMLRLCGSQILPYLDDLVGSIFGALDNFHGYPALVESLFGVLKAMVDESVKSNKRAITSGDEKVRHGKHSYNHTSMTAILTEVKTRKRKRVLRRQNVDELPETQSTDTQDPLDEVNNTESSSASEPSSSAIATKEESTTSRSQTILLSIAKAANPHLTSPSPRARQILLQLLAQVAPLLSEDENAFLPFINDIWPNVIARLLPTHQKGSDDEESTETNYNICTAALVVSALCQGAGDFMTSRIETLIPHLEKEYLQIFWKVQKRLQYQNKNNHVVRSSMLSTDNIRRGTTQVFEAFNALLSVVLQHVHVNGDVAGKIFEMLSLAYVIGRGATVREVLLSYNSDAVWLMDRREGIVSSDGI